LAHEEGHSPGVQAIGLARAPRTTAALRCPPGVDLVDGLTVCDEVLRETTPVIPRAFDALLTLVTDADSPGTKSFPAIWAIRPAPPIKLPPGIVEGDSDMDLLVSVDSEGDHGCLPV
jgi:hypothetical protein